MPQPTNKKRNATQPGSPSGAVKTGTAPIKGAAASRLRAQTRKVLGKHYRAKYGVR